MSVDFEALRRDQFPMAAATTYLNNCGRGPLPRCHVEAVKTSLDALADPLPFGAVEPVIESTRDSVAQLLGASTRNIALLGHTSQGLNIVPGGLDWEPGDEVILYELDHPTDIYPWLNLAHRGVVLRFVKDRGGRYDAEDVERLIGPRTRAVCLSLVNYAHGFRAPVEAIGAICRRKGIWFVVDAIMALGALQVDAPAIGADILVAHGYKLLLSGFGAAVVYASDRALTELRVAEIGYKGMEQVMAYTATPPDFSELVGKPIPLAHSARRFEAGTQAFSAIVGMQASIGLMLASGPAAIEARVLELFGRLTEGLREKGYQVASPGRDGERSPIVSFSRPGWNLEETSARLIRSGVQHIAIHQRIRFSPHFYNNADDIEAALSAL